MIEAWNTENMAPACWGKGKAKVPHLYRLTVVLPHVSTNPAQLYLQSGSTGYSGMFITECDEGLNMQDKGSQVLCLPPPRGAASIIFCSPNISCAANLCALQWMDKFLIQPSTGGVPNATLKLYFLSWSSVWSLISFQIVDLELSIWIPALPPSVALKYWVTINPDDSQFFFLFFPFLYPCLGRRLETTTTLAVTVQWICNWCSFY